MIPWNYRVFIDSQKLMSFRETHYTDTGEVNGWSSSCVPVGETIDELRYDLCGMLLALSKPILDEEKLQKIADRELAKSKAQKEKLKKK